MTAFDGRADDREPIDIETTTESPMLSISPEDYKDLIKQGVHLEGIQKELHDLKVQIREALLKIDFQRVDSDKRIDTLEKRDISVTAQIKTVLWLGGIAYALVQITIQLAFHYYGK